MELCYTAVLMNVLPMCFGDIFNVTRTHRCVILTPGLAVAILGHLMRFWVIGHDSGSSDKPSGRRSAFG